MCHVFPKGAGSAFAGFLIVASLVGCRTPSQVQRDEMAQRQARIDSIKAARTGAPRLNRTEQEIIRRRAEAVEALEDSTRTASPR